LDTIGNLFAVERYKKTGGAAEFCLMADKNAKEYAYI